MTKEKNIPELRFPEFKGEWKNGRLGEIATFSRGKSISKSDIVENGTLDCIRYGELYTVYSEIIDETVSKTNIDSKELVLSEKNDVIIPASGETQIDIATASCVLRNGIALSGDLNIIRSSLNGVFLSYYLNNARKLDIARLSQGISVVHLYSSQLKTLKINQPQPQEQQKIASFLTAVDQRIQLLLKKKEALEEYKKGVMQKIFSQEIRFKDENGNDFPKWEEKKLGEISQITTGKLDANAMVKNGIYRFYTCAKEYYQIDDYAFDTEALLISGNGANVGYVHHYKGKFNAYQRTYILYDISESYKYIKYYLDKNLHRRIHKEKKDGNTPYIVLGTLSEMMIHLPCEAEQERIASFLTFLDEVIESINIEIDKSKEFKKGLLQKMFV